MVPQNEKWAKMIEEVYGKNAMPVTRYATKKEANAFDVIKLTAITEAINTEYEIKFIDKKIYGTVRQNKWSENLCSQFESFDQYCEKGLALACGAKLILACLSQNLYPSRDAHNKGSVALAEKLGYHFDKEYAA